MGRPLTWALYIHIRSMTQLLLSGGSIPLKTRLAESYVLQTDDPNPGPNLIGNL